MRLNTKYFYEFGPFRLDPREHLLLRADKPLPLAPKAFELLSFLMQNQGRLLTKDQIMQGVWRDSFVEEANLTVWISVLRKTLGEGEGAPQYIETVPKKGYRFTAEEGSTGRERGAPPLRMVLARRAGVQNLILHLTASLVRLLISSNFVVFSC